MVRQRNRQAMRMVCTKALRYGKTKYKVKYLRKTENKPTWLDLSK